MIKGNGHGHEMAVRTCEHKQSGISNDCASNLRAALQIGKYETGVGMPIGRTCREEFDELTDEHFWQYLQGLLHEVQRCAYASKPELQPQQSL